MICTIVAKFACNLASKQGSYLVDVPKIEACHRLLVLLCCCEQTKALLYLASRTEIMAVQLEEDVMSTTTLRFLQQENTRLQEENKTLREENLGLRHYMDALKSLAWTRMNLILRFLSLFT